MSRLTKPKHHYGYERFKWTEDKLYHEGKFLVELIPHDKYSDMYNLKFMWRDEKTPEFFSKRNARENSMRIALYRLNYDVWESVLPASQVR